ncbi:MAG: hypothetical protein K6C34_00590 [Alphaproteobacteria bacterium]|nr:hypothetical protein [Alphaproteobacteria bacterium]
MIIILFIIMLSWKFDTDALDGSYNDDLARYQRRVSSLQRELAIATAAISKEREEKETWQRKYFEAVRQLDASDTALMPAAQQVNVKLSPTKTALGIRIIVLLNEAEQEKKRLSEQISVLEEKNGRLSEQIRGLEEEKGQLSEQIKGLEENVKRLNQEKDEAVTEKTSLLREQERNYQTLQSTYNTLTTEADKIKQELDRSTQKLEKYQTRSSELEEELKQYQAEEEGCCQSCTLL